MEHHLAPSEPERQTRSKRFLAYHRSATGDPQVEPSVLLHQQITRTDLLVAGLGAIVATRLMDFGSGTRMALLPGYKVMLRAISNREVDAIVAADLDRFGRNFRERTALFYLCQENSVEIWDAERGEPLSLPHMAGGPYLLRKMDARRGPRHRSLPRPADRLK